MFIIPNSACGSVVKFFDKLAKASVSNKNYFKFSSFPPLSSFNAVIESFIKSSIFFSKTVFSSN